MSKKLYAVEPIFKVIRFLDLAPEETYIGIINFLRDNAIQHTFRRKPKIPVASSSVAMITLDETGAQFPRNPLSYIACHYIDFRNEDDKNLFLLHFSELYGNSNSF